jgi:hypothetical protein
VLRLFAFLLFRFHGYMLPHYRELIKISCDIVSTAS